MIWPPWAFSFLPIATPLRTVPVAFTLSFLQFSPIWRSSLMRLIFLEYIIPSLFFKLTLMCLLDLRLSGRCSPQNLSLMSRLCDGTQVFVFQDILDMRCHGLCEFSIIIACLINCLFPPCTVCLSGQGTYLFSWISGIVSLLPHFTGRQSQGPPASRSLELSPSLDGKLTGSHPRGALGCLMIRDVYKYVHDFLHEEIMELTPF